jgi:hypothetical protein
MFSFAQLSRHLRLDQIKNAAVLDIFWRCSGLCREHGKFSAWG